MLRLITRFKQHASLYPQTSILLGALQELSSSIHSASSQGAIRAIATSAWALNADTATAVDVGSNNNEDLPLRKSRAGSRKARAEEIEAAVMSSAERILEGNYDDGEEEAAQNADELVFVDAVIDGTNKPKDKTEYIEDQDEAVLGLWEQKYRPQLVSYRAFITDLGLSEDYMIRRLFSMGYWGKMAMLPAGTHQPKDEAPPEQQQQQHTKAGESQRNSSTVVETSTATKTEQDTAEMSDWSELEDNQEEQEEEQWSKGDMSLAERNLLDWHNILASFDLHFNISNLVRRCPKLLTITPSKEKVAAVLDLLSAVLEDEAKVRMLVVDYPVVLTYSALGLQSQLLLLSIHCPGILPHLLAQAPQLLTVPRTWLERNVQILAQHTGSLEDFLQFVKRNPHLLAQRSVSSSVPALIERLNTMFEGTKIDAQQLIRVDPDLLLVRRTQSLVYAWQRLHEKISDVEPWKVELHILIEQAAAAKPHEVFDTYRPLAALVLANPRRWPRLIFMLENYNDEIMNTHNSSQPPVVQKTEADDDSNSNSSEGYTLQQAVNPYSLQGILLVLQEEFIEIYPEYEEWREERHPRREFHRGRRIIPQQVDGDDSAAVQTPRNNSFG